MLSIVFAIIVIVVLVFLYKKVEVDLTLKYCELFGKKVEELRGKVVWITGASSGIGEHLAYELATVGCKLVLSARRREELERVKARCCELATRDYNGEHDILVLPLDVTKFDTHQEAMKRVLDHFKQLDILVNNSGRSQRSLAVDTELKVDQDLFELNVMGCISMAKVVLPHMIERKTGHIVVLSSATGKFGVVYSATYAATKFALQGYFSSLQGEVFHQGIAVTLVCPGPIKSNVIENSVTEVAGQSFKEKQVKEDTAGRMDTDKFAKLLTIAIVNKLDECWISPQPVLWLLYAAQYMPSVFTWFLKRFAIKGLKKLRETGEKKEN